MPFTWNFGGRTKASCGEGSGSNAAHGFQTYLISRGYSQSLPLYDSAKLRLLSQVCSAGAKEDSDATRELAVAAE